MYAARAITRTLQLRTGAFVSRQSALLRPSQSRGNAAAAVVNDGLKNNIINSSTLKPSSSSNDNNDEAPPDFVRLGIQRMLEQAQQHGNYDNKYNGNNSHSNTEIENSKALQALELVQVRTYLRNTLYNFTRAYEYTKGASSWRIGLTYFVLYLSYSLYLLQDQLEETSLCIADCREAVDAVSFQEEFQAADAALEQAVLCFTDWLEDARTRNESTGDPVLSYKALREANTAQIKLLRRQLDQLKADSVSAV
jgi:hypothetical protein